MTQDEIMEMAREASSMARLPWNGEWIFRSKKELMAFASLVAAKEREACAQACEANRTNPPQGKPDDVERGFNAAIRRCAAAIRARGQKE